MLCVSHLNQVPISPHPWKFLIYCVECTCFRGFFFRPLSSFLPGGVSLLQWILRGWIIDVSHLLAKFPRDFRQPAHVTLFFASESRGKQCTMAPQSNLCNFCRAHSEVKVPPSSSQPRLAVPKSSLTVLTSQGTIALKETSMPRFPAFLLFLTVQASLAGEAFELQREFT